MRNSLEYLTEAHQALDETGQVLTSLAMLSPDYSMRMVIAAREILLRHKPEGEVRRERCAFDGLLYPCPDTRSVLAIVGVSPDEDPDGE